MVAHQVLVEVLGREVPIARAVLLQDPFDLVKRRAAPRGPPQAPLHKTRRPLGLVAVAKPAKMTLRHPQDLRRLQTAQRAAAIAAQCFCYAHNPYLRIHRYPRFLGTLQETGHIACYTFRTYLVLLTFTQPGLVPAGGIGIALFTINQSRALAMKVFVRRRGRTHGRLVTACFCTRHCVGLFRPRS